MSAPEVCRCTRCLCWRSTRLPNRICGRCAAGNHLGELPAMTTEAGRRLLDDHPARYGGMLWADPVSRQLTEEAIAAIEAEARDTLLAELEAGVEGLRFDGLDESYCWEEEIRAAVLDLIRKAGQQ